MIFLQKAKSVLETNIICDNQRNSVKPNWVRLGKKTRCYMEFGQEVYWLQHVRHAPYMTQTSIIQDQSALTQVLFGALSAIYSLFVNWRAPTWLCVIVPEEGAIVILEYVAMQVFENLKIVCITACIWRHIISEFQCTQYTGASFSWYISDTHSYGAYECHVIYVASIARSVFCSSKSCPNFEAWKSVLKYSALSLDKHTLSPHATTCMPQLFWTKKRSPKDQRMVKKSLLTETC